MNKERYESSAKGAFFGWVGIIVVVIFLLLTSCYGTYYISDAEYSDLREEHAVTVPYHQGDQIYTGVFIVDITIIMEHHITILGTITIIRVHHHIITQLLTL